MAVAVLKPRIAIIVSAPITVKAFLHHPILALSNDYNVTVFANAATADCLGDLADLVDFQPLPINRSIAPLRDLYALWRTYRFLDRLKFDVVHSITPKAGLIAMVAAYAARVPCRIHTFTGQVWVTRRGVTRALLRTMDRKIASFSTLIVVDSPSQQDFLVQEAIVTRVESRVLADGSISGVDLQRFRPSPLHRSRIRAELRVGDDAPLALFLGRLKHDKGVTDLARAFSILHKRNPHYRLALVGPDEDGLQAELVSILRGCADAIHIVPYTNEPEAYMAAADVFCLPSYREGFGSVIIEAGSCGLPSVASRIYGVTDAVVEGRTGLLHNPGDVDAIARALGALLSDTRFRKGMGDAARERALSLFSQQRLSQEWVNLYAEQLAPPILL